jgi:DNA-binding response OmpR family regulator
VPIVFLTAIDGEAHQAFRGYAAGAVDYLSKPFDPWVLRAKVGVFIELYERRRELASQAAELRQQLEQYTGADVQPQLLRAADAIAEAQRLLAGTEAPDVDKQLAVAADALAALRTTLRAGRAP